jgi:ribosomal protein S18 acetylase RimI-like enzyme
MEAVIMDELRGSWVRFRWDLVHASLPTIPPAYTTIARGNRDSAAEILEVVVAAYASDPVWQAMLPAITARMQSRIAETISDESCEYIMLSRDGAVVGVSGIAETHWTGQNLLTGICIRPEFQRQRYGTFLLGYSLHRLRARGLKEAVVYTENGSLADRKIYPLFGGVRQANVEYPGARARPPGVTSPSQSRQERR